MKPSFLTYWTVRIICMLIGSTLMAGTSTFDFGKVDAASKDASIICVLSNPDQYIGKKVRVIGVYFHDFEGSYLFFSRDALEAYDVSSAIELPISEKLLPAPVSEIELLNGCLVAIEGVVNSDGTRVSLKDVSRILLKGRGPTKSMEVKQK